MSRRRRTIPFPHLVRIARELSSAYTAVETATAILRTDRGPNSVPMRRGIKAMVAIDEIRQSLEAPVRVWVASDAAVTRLLYGHDAVARPTELDEDGES
jgi:hypothetical protein